MIAKYYILDDSMIAGDFVPWEHNLEESSRNDLIKSINNILKAEEVKAPDEYDKDKFTLFLAGSIDMGKSEDWQAKLVKELKPFDVLILNPRREEWDASWEQNIDNPKFKEQVDWELDGQANADIIVMNFLPESKSPITLLELGLFADASKLIVCCPEGFYRKGNVDIVCKKYGVKEVETFDDLIKSVKSRLQDIKLDMIEKQSYSPQDQQVGELANQTKEESKEKPTGIPTKNLIISKLDTLFEKTSENNDKVTIYGNFKSGDSEVRLKGKGDTYEITINGTSVREFQDFSRALADFYDQINLLLRSKEKDVDTDFQIFSEVIRNQNMKVVPLLSQLNKSLDAEKIGRLEKWYDFNSFDKEEFFAKYNSSCESCRYFRNIEKESMGCFCNDDILKSTNSLCLNYVSKAVPQIATGIQPMPNEPELTRDIGKPEKADPKHQIHLHPEEEFPLLGKSND